MSSKPKLQKYHKNRFIYILIGFVLVYSVFSLVASRTEIAKKRAEYEAVHAKLTETLDTNEQLKSYAEDSNEYMEDIARDKLGYADPRERIYYIIPG